MPHVSMGRFAIAVVLLSAAAAVWAVCNRKEFAELRVDKAQIDFGKVVPGEPLVAKFRLTNVGKQYLLVKELATSCGCAPPSLSHSRIGPGGEAVLTVPFKSPNRPGGFAHQIYFRTNAPATNQGVTLSLSGTAEWPIDVTPPNLHVGILQRESDFSRELNVYSLGDTPFRVVAAEASAPWMSVDGIGQQPARSHRLRVIATRPSLLSNFSESVRILTDVPKRSVITIPVTGEVVASQTVPPKILLLGQRPPSARVEKTLVISTPSGASPLSVTISSDSSWQVAEWRCDKVSEDMTKCSVTLRVPTESGYRRTDLIVQLSGDVVLRVPVSCFVAANAGQAPTILSREAP